MFCDKLGKFIKSTNSEKFYFSPLNTILASIILFPILMMNRGIDDLQLFINLFLLFIGFQFLLLFLKFLCIKDYKKLFSDIASSIPKFSLFHILMFILIGFPFLFFLGSIIVAIIES